MQPLLPEEILPVVRAALAEDVGSGDITTLSTVPDSVIAAAGVVAREPLVVAGLAVAAAVWREVSPRVEVRFEAADGARCGAGEPLMSVRGAAAALLTGERVALNFLQRMCGVATLTRQYVDAVAGTRAVILDTRKTTPGLRRFEKYAVLCGGGQNHRFGLYDAVLIKDNHLAALHGVRPEPIAVAIRRVRERFPERTVEVEADNLEQVDQAVAAGADMILLDNMPPGVLREAVRRVGGRARTEASGGVNVQTVRDIAETGVDCISVGALTHGARAMDIALDFEVA